MSASQHAKSLNIDKNHMPYSYEVYPLGNSYVAEDKNHALFYYATPQALLAGLLPSSGGVSFFFFNGTYTFTASFTYPDMGNQDFDIYITGESRKGVIFLGASDITIFDSGLAAWKSGYSQQIFLENLTIQGVLGNPIVDLTYYFLGLNNVDVIGTVATDSFGLDWGGTASPTNGLTWEDVHIHVTGTNVSQMRGGCDGLTIVNLSFGITDTPTTQYPCILIGNDIVINHIGFWLESGDSVNTALMYFYGSLLHVHIDHIKFALTTDGTATLFATASGGATKPLVTIENIQLEQSGRTITLFKDATTQASINIKGSYNGYQLERAFADVADGVAVNHNVLGCTPQSVHAQTTVSGEFASVTAITSTQITFAIKTHAGAAGTTQTLYVRIRP